MNKAILPIAMKKQVMIEDFIFLYHNYNSQKQTINIQAMYIEVLMDMLLKHGVSQEKINEMIDGNKKIIR